MTIVAAPTELVLSLTPRARVDCIDVRSEAIRHFKDALTGYRHCAYVSGHTTAGYLPQSLAARLAARPQGLRGYVDLFRTMFPEGAGYRHDQLELREELAPEQRLVEPANADSHLAFMSSGLHACVTYDARRPGPVYFVDLDGMSDGTARRRKTTLVGYDQEEVVARDSTRIGVSSHPIDAVNLKDAQFGLSDQITELIRRHGVTKGRIRLELPADEQFASLTVNEYETLLMRHDLAEILNNPLRFAAEKARHAWDDPMAVPGKALSYARYDLVRAMNRLVDVLGLQASRVEHLIARALEVPASRFMRMNRSVDLLVSDGSSPGEGRLVAGTYQTPILVQWRPARESARSVNVSLTRFL